MGDGMCKGRLKMVGVRWCRAGDGVAGDNRAGDSMAGDSMGQEMAGQETMEQETAGWETVQGRRQWGGSVDVGTFVSPLLAVWGNIC